jgi:hypothetical protein
MSNPLNAVLKYELTRREADAYKVGIIFSHLCKKMFPDAVPQGFGAGDPRKKVLFKHCWKMLAEVEAGVRNLREIDERERFVACRTEYDMGLRITSAASAAA